MSDAGREASPPSDATSCSVLARLIRAGGREPWELAFVATADDESRPDEDDLAIDVERDGGPAKVVVVDRRRFAGLGAGRLSLETCGLRSRSIEIAPRARWTGPGVVLETRGGRLVAVRTPAGLVVDEVWPEAVAAGLVGRPLADVLDHHALRMEDLDVTGVRTRDGWTRFETCQLLEPLRRG